ncbi:MAG: hypothetical protein RLZZ399_1350 [Verrucomicrobiota bacterium]|jgi:chorismate-pyruvate lyase
MNTFKPEWLEPLERLRGATLGSFEWVDPGKMPEPFRGLLVHSGDMTSRLEAFHRGQIVLEVLRSLDHGDGRYSREVVLRRGRDREAVEYGAIEIFLDVFEAELRAKILAGNVPLGGLLNAAGLHYHSEPQAFFVVNSGAVLSALIGVREGEALYGRCNVLRHDDGRLIARIVEILPALTGP